MDPPEKKIHLIITDEQRLVVETGVEQRMLVVAGPGAGKTQIAAMRLAHMLTNGLRPSATLVLSFSRSAVATLTRRISGLKGQPAATVEELRHLAIRTFDSWTFRVLRQLGYSAEDLLGRTHDENIDELIDLMHSARRDEIRILLSKIRHVLVDELQDLAGVRGDLVFELLELIAAPRCPGVGFTLLGDPAQSIYGFSTRRSDRKCLHGGTTSQLLGSLHQEWKSELVHRELNQNHRAVPEIAGLLEPLRKVLRLAIDPSEKLARVAAALSEQPRADFELGKPVLELSEERSIGILARTNAEVMRVAQRILGDEVKGPELPIFVGADQAAAPAWVAALLGPVRANVITRSQFDAILARAASDMPEALHALPVNDPTIAWRRLVIAAGLPMDATSFQVRELSRRLNWTDAFPDDQSVPEAGLFISTIHQSKGREFDLVAILDQGREEAGGRDTDPEEEAYVGFVALSRAAKRLVRIPADSIYAPPASRTFANGTRSRLCYWRNGWVNLEMGITGDIDSASFADTRFFGSSDAVDDNFRFLAANARTLIGHKVMLRKCRVPDVAERKFRYEICLQDGKQPGRRIGLMGQNVVWDLLGILHRYKISLPSLIMNLRVSRVVSLSIGGGDEDRVSSRFSGSGMWLGVELFGTGDFRTARSPPKPLGAAR